MAKFTNKDLRLKDGQKVTWGTDLDANMWYDGTADQLRVDTTISGVDPTESYHLTTRWYVDSEIATTSGSLQDQLDGLTLDHGGLDGLADDDHTQYILVDGTRGFTGTVSGIDPTESYHLATKWYLDNELATLSGGIVQDHGGLTGLGDDDHTQYTLADGTRAFTGTVGGITPTQDSHLTTKGYVDSAIQGLDWQDSVIDYHSPSGGLPAGPNVGDRYVADDSGNGWTQNNIYEWDGSQWEETVANEGMSTWFEDEDLLRVYDGTNWIRFGSTVTHRNLNDLQGGTSDEYYHLTSAQFEALTDNNANVDDATSQHHHDSRYYTETEMDATISGLESDINTYSDHGALSGLGDDDHTQYTLADGTRAFTGVVGGITPTLPAHLTTKQYVDDEIATLSGSLDSDLDDHINDATIHFTEASIDHGSISGLGDDDHTQYILVDGSRGFTSTVSGVYPVLDSDLATKAYVDASDQPQLHGRQAIADGASTVTVSFADVGSTNYTVNATMENTADSPPSVYAFIVSAKTSSSFTVTFMGDMDSANYILDWIIIQD
jgi:hypothetical protein